MEQEVKMKIEKLYYHAYDGISDKSLCDKINEIIYELQSFERIREFHMDSITNTSIEHRKILEKLETQVSHCIGYINEHADELKEIKEELQTQAIKITEIGECKCEEEKEECFCGCHTRNSIDCNTCKCEKDEPLLKCPFCASEPEINQPWERYSWFTVVCSQCKSPEAGSIVFHRAKTKQEAIEAWNRRK